MYNGEKLQETAANLFAGMVSWRVKTHDKKKQKID